MVLYVVTVFITSSMIMGRGTMCLKSKWCSILVRSHCQPECSAKKKQAIQTDERSRESTLIRSWASIGRKKWHYKLIINFPNLLMTWVVSAAWCWLGRDLRKTRREKGRLAESMCHWVSAGWHDENDSGMGPSSPLFKPDASFLLRRVHFQVT